MNNVKDLISTAVLIIAVRESCVWICGLFGHEELGSLLGLFLLLTVLLVIKRVKGQLSQRLIHANAKIMKESGFALIPFVAGASTLLLLVKPNELVAFMAVMTIATVIPLFFLAYLAKRSV